MRWIMKERLAFVPLESREEDKSSSELMFDVSKEIIMPFTGSRILFATTETGFRVVIKISKRENSAEREWVGLNKVYDAGVPVPQPLLLAQDERGNKALISQRIKGKNLFFHPNDQIKHQLGQIIRVMQEQTAIEGNEWLKDGKPDFSYYDRYLFYWLRGPVEGLRSGSKTQVLLEKFTDSMKDYCDEVLPVFTHQDIHDGQVLIKDGKPILIDFEDWKEDGPLSEIAHYLFHSIRCQRPAEGFRNFIKGYLDSGKLSENEKSVLMFYLLFISARAVNYFNYYGHSYLKTAEITHQKILDYVDQEKLWKEF